MPKIKKGRSSQIAITTNPALNFAFILYPKVKVSKERIAEGLYWDNAPITDIVCVSPLHTQADNEEEIIKPHHHCLIKLKKCQRLSYIQKRIEFNLGLFLPLQDLEHHDKVKMSRLIGITRPQVVSDFGAQYRYLTHENDYHKELFKERPAVIGRATVEDLDKLYLSHTMKTEDAMRSISQIEKDIVLDGGYENYAQFLLKYPALHDIAEGSPSWYAFRSIAQARSNHLRHYIAEVNALGLNAKEELITICETSQLSKKGANHG